MAEPDPYAMLALGAFLAPVLIGICFVVYMMHNMRTAVLLVVDSNGDLLLREEIVSHFWDKRVVWERAMDIAVRFEAGIPEEGLHLDKLVSRNFKVTDSYYLFTPGASEKRALAVRQKEKEKEERSKKNERDEEKGSSDSDSDSEDEKEAEAAEDALGNPVPQIWIDEMPRTAAKLVCRKMFDADSATGIATHHVRKVDDQCHGYVVRVKTSEEKTKAQWTKLRGANRLGRIMPALGSPNRRLGILPPLAVSPQPRGLVGSDDEDTGALGSPAQPGAVESPPPRGQEAQAQAE